MSVFVLNYIYKMIGLEDLKIDFIDDKYKRLRELTIRIQFVVLLIVYMVVIFGYFKAGYYYLMALASVSFVISFSCALIKKKQLSSNLAGLLFIYLPITNLFIKDVFFLIQGNELINVFFLHTHFILLLFISFGGLISNERNILYVGAISIVWIWIFTVYLNDSFLWSILLLDTVFFVGISFIIYFAYSSTRLFYLKLCDQAQLLSRQYEELNELLRLKDWMLNVIVHDIKNPINRILAASKMDVVQKDEIIQPSEQIRSIVENILDVCKMEDSKVSLKLSVRDVGSIIDEAFGQVKYMVDVKNIRFETHLSVNPVIDVDVELFIRVFVNLLSNSIKFSEQNSAIEINVTSISDKVRVEVVDHGAGIDSKDIGRIFEKHYQAGARNLGVTRSTGIGLTFCKFVVEAHGGVIGADSVLNSGTTLWFEIPMKLTADSVSDELIKYSSLNAEISSKEEEMLTEYKLKLEGLAVYQTSEIMQVLGDISSCQSSLVAHWKDEVLKSSMTGNVEYFYRLKAV